MGLDTHEIINQSYPPPPSPPELVNNVKLAVHVSNKKKSDRNESNTGKDAAI
jgi:hypothetical protein